ncbi:alpha/beta fold hydrolase [Ancylobacter oerskovii]|uniref:Proline iminopeptidase n=1 Tax=Ancylobacter oerskovii TaxID=459519 RepID=A0ABW4YWJ7_9HYPH|nr:alpha/beta hydrolase [Ancylobacter oerskovii]MBS7544103.1 alpha/beta hydrolase [Ancylobacter oerskovii]
MPRPWNPLASARRWLLIAGIVSAAACPAQAASFEEGACPRTSVPVPALQEARCGYLTVPETRARPGSRMIRLPVALLPARDKKADDPIVYLEGGPGGPVMPSATVMVEAGFNRFRDVILMGQRGSLYAQPSLICPEVDATGGPLVGMRRNGEQARELYVGANRACRERLAREGVDLSAYNSTESAADLADLRKALHIPLWNVLGVSYGTDLALTYMRQHPEGIRSVILDSVLPPALASVALNWTSQRQGLDAIFAACAADAACRQRYPDPLGTLEALVRAYEAKPLKTRLVPALYPLAPPEPDAPAVDVVIDGASIAYWAGAASELYGNRLPELLYEMAAGRMEGVASIIAAIGFAHSAEPLSYGLQNGVMCSEWIAYEAADSVLQAGLRAFPAYPASVRSQAPQFPFAAEVCKVWNVARAPEAQRDPTASAIPTLVIAGSYDAMTSAQNARFVARSLPRATLIVLPGIGHYVLPKSDCARSVMYSLLTAPDSRPDVSCVDALNVPPFVIAPE